MKKYIPTFWSFYLCLTLSMCCKASSMYIRSPWKTLLTTAVLYSTCAIAKETSLLTEQESYFVPSIEEDNTLLNTDRSFGLKDLTQEVSEPAQVYNDFFEALLEETTTSPPDDKDVILHDDNWILIPKGISYNSDELHLNLQEDDTESDIYINYGDVSELLWYIIAAPIGLCVWILDRRGKCTEDNKRYRALIIGGNAMGTGLRVLSDWIGEQCCCICCSKCCMCLTCAYIVCPFKIVCCGWCRTRKEVNPDTGEVIITKGGNVPRKSNYLKEEMGIGFEDKISETAKKELYKDLLERQQKRYLSLRVGHLRPFWSYFCCSRDVYKGEEEFIEYICCCIKSRYIPQKAYIDSRGQLVHLVKQGETL